MLLHRLHGVFRPHTSWLGRPRAEPIKDGVFPLAILCLLDFPDQGVEYI